MSEESPDLKRYQEAQEAYERFLEANPNLRTLAVIAEELNAATAAVEALVRNDLVTHPDFVPVRSHLRLDVGGLLKLMDVETALTLGYVTREYKYTINREALEEAITQGIFTPEELQVFCHETTSYKTPDKVQLR